MQPLTHEPEIIKGVEVLSFESAEINKNLGDGTNAFGSEGRLSVLYFDYFERFVLQINNWRYTLTPRIPVTRSALPGGLAPLFTMPAIDGAFHLKINHPVNMAALDNLMTIFRNSTKFNEVVQDLEMIEEVPAVQRTSGAFIRESHESVSQPGQITTINRTEIIPVHTATVSAVIHDVPAENIKSSQNYYSAGYLERTGQATNIGNRSYQQPWTLNDPKLEKKKGLKAKLGMKLSKKKAQLRENPNLTQVSPYERLRMSTEATCPAYAFPRQEVELSVVGARLIAKKLERPETLTNQQMKQNVIDAIKEGASEIKDAITRKIQGAPEAHPVPSALDIIRQGMTEIKANINQGSGKRSTGANFITIMDGIKDIKYRIATREYHAKADLIHGDENLEAQEPETKLQMLKEMATEVKDIIKNKIHEVKGTEHGEFQPETEPVQRKPLMTSVKESVSHMRVEAHDFKERVVERAHVAEGTVGQEQRPGIGVLVKEGVNEIKERIAARRQAHMEIGVEEQRPSIVTRMRGEAHDFKERVVLRARIAENITSEEQRPSVMSMIKEGVHEIQERITKKPHEGTGEVYTDPGVRLNTENSVPISQYGADVLPGRILGVTPIARSNPIESQVRQMYPAPQIIHSQDYTPIKENIKDPVTIVYTFERYKNVPSTGIEGLTPYEIVTHTERTSAANAALIMEKIHNGHSLEEIERLGTPLGHTVGDKVKNFIQGGISCRKSTTTDKGELLLERNPNIILEPISPVSKRELIKASLPVLLNQATDGQVSASHPSAKEVIKAIPQLLHKTDESNIKPMESSEIPISFGDKVRSKVPFMSEKEHHVVPKIQAEPVGFVAGGIEKLNHLEYQPTLIQQVKSKIPFLNKSQQQEVGSTVIRSYQETDENFTGRLAESHNDTLLHKEYEMVTDQGKNLESHLLKPKGGETVDIGEPAILQDTVSSMRPSYRDNNTLNQMRDSHIADQNMARRSGLTHSLATSEQRVYESMVDYA